jgi:hypothetical protein
MRKGLIYILSILALTGCIMRPWTPTTNTEYTSASQNVSLRLPEGWMLSGRKDILLVTRDGVLLQNIIIEPINVEDEMKYTKKKLRRGMSPLEQAEVILDNLASDPDRTALKVMSKKPAKVAGHQAFRAEIEFKDKDGLAYQAILYGFMQNNWFYLVRYLAPERHYFPRDEGKFEKMVASMKLLI